VCDTLSARAVRYVFVRYDFGSAATNMDTLWDVNQPEYVSGMLFAWLLLVSCHQLCRLRRRRLSDAMLVHRDVQCCFLRTAAARQRRRVTRFFCIGAGVSRIQVWLPFGIQLCRRGCRIDSAVAPCPY
jgi:hypothetical protein